MIVGPALLVEEEAVRVGGGVADDIAAGDAVGGLQLPHQRQGGIDLRRPAEDLLFGPQTGVALQRLDDLDADRHVVEPDGVPALQRERHELGPSWDVRSDFAERFWLPRVGPTSFLLHRRLAKGLAGRAGIRVTSFELSKSMGLGGGLGSSAPLAKSLQRLAAFGAARWDEGVFWVSREVRPLANPSALPEHLQRAG